MKPKVLLGILIAVMFLIKIAFLFSWHEVWWDEGVYVGMGKHVMSGGDSGLWEHIRPPLVPLLLGLFWKIGDPLVLGRLLEVLLSVGIVILTFLIARKWFDDRVALVSSALIAFSPIFFYLSFHAYTEIPSVFFVLLSLWLFLEERWLLAGMSIGLSFLAKFPSGIFIAILGIFSLSKKQFNPAILLASGFSIIVAPYFLWSWIAYGNPLATVIAARETIGRVLGCNVLRHQPWWHYFALLVKSESPIYWMVLPGVFAVYKFWSKKLWLFSFSLLIPLLYFIQLNCRDYRYAALFIPFAAMLAAFGVIFIFDLVKKRKNFWFVLLFVLLSAWFAATSLLFYFGNEVQTPVKVSEEYFSFPTEKGEIWTSNPVLAAYTDEKLEKVYYPVYDSDVSLTFLDYVQKHHDRISSVFLDNCGGGIICAEEDSSCIEQTEKLIVELDSNFNRVFDKSVGRCWFRIWASS